MKERTILTLVVAYFLILLYAGFFAQYRDIEDVCNQLSHVFITGALTTVYWIDNPKRTATKYIVLSLTILNIIELIDELRKANNAGATPKDYIFVSITVLITLFIVWKSLKKK